MGDGENNHVKGSPMSLVYRAKWQLRLFALLCMIAMSSFAQEKAPADKAFDAMEAGMAMKCEAGKLQAQLSSKKHDAFLGSLSAELACECVPGKIKALRAGLTHEAMVKMQKEEIVAAVEPLLESCTASMLRKMFGKGCPDMVGNDPKIKNGQAYCSCMASKYALISDKELANYARESYRHFERRVQAKTSGTAPPEKGELLERLDAIEAACSAE